LELVLTKSSAAVAVAERVSRLPGHASARPPVRAVATVWDAAPVWQRNPDVAPASRPAAPLRSASEHSVLAPPPRSALEHSVLALSLRLDARA
jgi:hypothetical protein